MPDFNNINTNQDAAPWIRGAAFNNAYTYSYISKAPFYAMISHEYYAFMNRFVKNWLWWADGYVPYFHNGEQGIPSTRIGTALVDRIAKKVVGGRIMFKNVGKEKSAGKDPNPSLSAVSEWALDCDFPTAVKKAVNYAAAAGTALLKLNKDSKGLWAEALRFDSFLPAVNSRGEIEEIKCFLRFFTNIGVRLEDNKSFQGFYIVERRYFGEYQTIKGEILDNVPLVEYVIHRQQGSVVNGEYLSQSMTERVNFRDLPKSMRRSIGRTYPQVRFDEASLLPFKDNLGCELIKWTDGVSGLPELPFGESLLSNIVAQMQSWDYYHAAANTDMYTGRARVLLPKQMGGAADAGYNSGLDSYTYQQYQTTDPEGQRPTPIQFDLRSSQWRDIRDRLIQDISILTGLNISTIASFISDSTAAKTAREISTEENETAEFINDKRSILEKPVNRILNTVRLYYGLEDAVAVRWSAAGMTNRFVLTEMLSQAKNAGLVSSRKAVELWNYDDDTMQVEEEYGRILKDMEAFDGTGGGEAYPGEQDFGAEVEEGLEGLNIDNGDAEE